MGGLGVVGEPPLGSFLAGAGCALFCRWGRVGLVRLTGGYEFRVGVGVWGRWVGRLGVCLYGAVAGCCLDGATGRRGGAVRAVLGCRVVAQVGGVGAGDLGKRVIYEGDGLPCRMPRVSGYTGCGRVS